ncbi:MAG: Flp family type IVb pilin [Acidimicrobiia bacterium]|nr:Flp family type IVb pilin [Acidimicrobiia bacterium]
MSRLMKRLRRETGATLVEYALVASLIALPSVAAMNAISTTMNEEFNAIEDNAASAGHGTTTTAAPTTTTSGGGSTTTTTSTTSTTSTTAAPTTTSTTTTSTTTTSTTTTTAPPPTTTTSPPGAPPYQTETAYTPGGWLRFELDNGEINLDGYDLYWGWRGSMWRNGDGSLTIHLWERWDDGEVWVHAYLDENGYLQTSIS